MAQLTLSDLLPVADTLADANAVATAYNRIVAAVNAIDDTQFAAGKIFDPAKLKQNAAATGQGLVWLGSQWGPASLTALTSGVLSGANTDLAAPAAGCVASSYSVITTGGGTLRSVGAPSYAGCRFTLRNTISSTVTVKHNLAGGTGAVLFARTAADVTLAQYESIEFVYDGTMWVEVSRDQTVSLGGSVAHATRAADISTTGTSFGTGADLLASALSFTADGTSDYLYMCSIGKVYDTANSTVVHLSLNQDSTDVGEIGYVDCAGTVQVLVPATVSTVIAAPSAGAHTVNTRMWVDGGTGHAVGGTAGVAGDNLRPIAVTVWRLV